MTLVELCRQLVGIDSSVSHGNREIAHFVSELAQSWGFEVENQEETIRGRTNINVVIKPKSRSASDEFLLISKLDTQDPGDYALWVKTGANPFNLSVNGEHLYGLGLTNAKADFACKLLTLKNFATANFKKCKPILVGTFGQASGAGAIRLLRKRKLIAQKALVGAPTQLNLASKGPGYAKVEISIPFTEEERHQRESHSVAEGSITQSKIFNRPTGLQFDDSLLANPVYRAMEYTKKLPEGMLLVNLDGGTSSESEPNSAFLEIDIIDGLHTGMLHKLTKLGECLRELSLQLKTWRDENCHPDHSTIHIGKVRTYDDALVISGFCRLVPSKDRTVYDTWLSRMRSECERVGAQLRVLDYKPPFEVDQNSPYFCALRKMVPQGSQKKVLTAAATCTEASVLNRLGVETLVFGPGELNEGAKSSQEGLSTKDLEEGMAFYTRVIEEFCL